MVTAGTEPAVIPLTEVDVLFSKVREKPILILLTLLHEGPLHCVCISYVSFMWEKKGAVVPFTLSFYVAVSLLSPPSHEHYLLMTDEEAFLP